MGFFEYFIIFIIKFYKFFISPLFLPSCRFLPTCSEYFIDCIKQHGAVKGSFLGMKRISKCHPFKILGGSSGLDLVPKNKIIRKKSKWT